MNKLLLTLPLLGLVACNTPQQRCLFGHQDDVVYGHDWQRLADSTYNDTRSSVCDLTGHMPDLIGFDLGGAELCRSRNLDSVPFNRMLEESRRQFLRGGKVTLSFHMRNPLTLGNSWDTTSCLSEALRPGSAVHDTLACWLVRTAQMARRISDLQTADGQLILRAWHEQSGNWFWWCRDFASADEYKALWAWTRHVFDSVGVRADWAYSPDRLTLYDDTPEGALRETREWYPGDEYVDIIGTDCYHFGGAEGTADYLHRAHRQLGASYALAQERGKRLAFTETGNEGIRCPQWYTSVLLPLLREYPVEYVLVWRNAWDIPTHYYVPIPGHPEADDFIRFMTSY